ncbi:amidoligase family protein [Maribius pontilimi]|uniref:Amidoligase family protein n=1 Tax=Palleronia pontilimi TaxID=1964209 RepID=A0A934IED2_9RHOB|nr:amidoligase family protein [Palleronia pontilimi]MBJ3761622.1 amidoligase family protein [Palleronia pontilimi]
MITSIDTLPRQTLTDGGTRRVGIEVELGGLSEREVGERIARVLGGTLKQRDDYLWAVTKTRLGDFEILLDTALRDRAKNALVQRGLDLGRAVIPVEYVTEPILPTQIQLIDTLNRALADAGARGTQDGIALGFGVHLNIATTGRQVADVLPTLQAFALVEDWLRARMDIDPSRRLLPFIDPYDAALMDRLAAPDADGWRMDDLMDAYLAHAASRNHALDLLPFLKDIDAARVVGAVPQMEDKGARPAYHYRLPDCRIDDADWSVAQEWSRWCGVERVAADKGLLSKLRAAWRDHRDGHGLPGGWRDVSAPLIEGSGAFL